MDVAADMKCHLLKRVVSPDAVEEIAYGLDAITRELAKTIINVEVAVFVIGYDSEVHVNGTPFGMDDVALVYFLAVAVYKSCELTYSVGPYRVICYCVAVLIRVGSRNVVAGIAQHKIAIEPFPCYYSEPSEFDVSHFIFVLVRNSGLS